MLSIESHKVVNGQLYVTTVLDPACINPSNKITFSNVNELPFDSLEDAHAYVEAFNTFFKL
jgi:hypothetical protein